MPSMKTLVIVVVAVAAGWYLSTHRSLLGPLNPG